MTTDAENALADIRGALVASGYYTSVVVLMHEDRTLLEAALAASRKRSISLALRLGSRRSTRWTRSLAACRGTAWRILEGR